MIDLETEYKNFENTWLSLGANFNSFCLGEDKMYHLSSEVKNLTDSEKILFLSCINTALAVWLIQAREKQAEIDSLKAENEELKTAYSGTNAALLEQLKINSDLHEKLLGVSDGEYVVIKKDDIENWYLDEGEYVWYEKDSIDGYLEDLDNGEVLEVQRKEYVVINSNPVFATNVYEDADNINWELFDSKEEAEKAATHCKAMVEAQGDGDE